MVEDEDVSLKLPAGHWTLTGRHHHHPLPYLVPTHLNTVEPPIMDTPNKGHNRKKPLYKGHTKVSKVHFPIILVTSEERTTSL